MSADNYHMLRRHPLGGFALVMGFESDEEIPEVHSNFIKFDTIEEAILRYAREDAEGNIPSEYGLRIHPEVYVRPVTTWVLEVYANSDINSTVSARLVMSYDPNANTLASEPYDQETHGLLRVKGTMVPE